MRGKTTTEFLIYIANNRKINKNLKYPRKIPICSTSTIISLYSNKCLLKLKNFFILSHCTARVTFKFNVTEKQNNWVLTFDITSNHFYIIYCIGMNVLHNNR